LDELLLILASDKSDPFAFGVTKDLFGNGGKHFVGSKLLVDPKIFL
jgi:hypothetical protein